MTRSALQALCAATILLLAAAAARAQGGDGQAPAMAMGSGRMVQGTVTATAPDHLTVKTPQGDTYQVSVSANTQVRKGRDPVKLADVHVGDGVGAMGEIDAPNKTVHALILTVVSAEEIQKAKDAMGKTVIAGTVTAINDLKLTIKRTDGVEQIIMVDEDTSFRRGGRAMQTLLAGPGMGGGFGVAGGGQRRQVGGAAGANPQADEGESITLADVKVGSTVAGQGSLKNGIFVPTQLGVMEPGARRGGGRRPDGATPPATPPPATPPPATPPPASMEPR